MLPAACVEPDGAVAPMRAAGARDDDSLATLDNPTSSDGDGQNYEKCPLGCALSTEASAIGSTVRPDGPISGNQNVTICVFERCA